jgi:hypothetical protein
MPIGADVTLSKKTFVNVHSAENIRDDYLIGKVLGSGKFITFTSNLKQVLLYLLCVLLLIVSITYLIVFSCRCFWWSETVHSSQDRGKESRQNHQEEFPPRQRRDKVLARNRNPQKYGKNYQLLSDFNRIILTSWGCLRFIKTPRDTLLSQSIAAVENYSSKLLRGLITVREMLLSLSSKYSPQCLTVILWKLCTEI